MKKAPAVIVELWKLHLSKASSLCRLSKTLLQSISFVHFVIIFISRSAVIRLHLTVRQHSSHMY